MWFAPPERLMVSMALDQVLGRHTPRRAAT